ncbi:hypothetical protein DDE18_08265 [Nocardioides gansuensis]|uniref:Uncharacterized protein n=2 Tax=Nocardioides gansuensis TaxID=2138300 RepID=A0A2T8FC45_9ACTN|nr:hypothetical protein DDE18_08265 [Nocardioides gansuensis]
MSAGLLALVTGLSLVPGLPAAAGDEDGASPRVTSPRRAHLARPTASALPPTPRAALAVASRVLEGDARAGDPSATVALRDLWLARPDLTGEDSEQAEAMLARPTDGAADPFGTGYTAPSTKTCGPHVCVHYVPTTADAPPSPEWVALNLATLEQTWKKEVGKFGYRKPVGDRGLGGNSKLDVYLKDLGAGLYGYCAAEHRAKARTASGFCVLDNDYHPTQFPAATPTQNLQVTAAHEFFHAVQYAYDYGDDGWFMESTATWMEERVADDVDDNRQFLPVSQLSAPMIPLDAFSTTYGFQYGNWIFWEYLTKRFDKRLVKDAWKAAGSLRGDGRKYSVEALKTVLARRGGLPAVYAAFGSGNLVPAQTYPEGSAYPATVPLREVGLSKAARRYGETVRLDHLTHDSIKFVPGADLGSGRWRLKVRIAGPSRKSGPAAQVLVVLHNGKLSKQRVRLNRKGNGSVKVKFSARKVAAVFVTAANASTRYKCGKESPFACQGASRDDQKAFKIKGSAVKVKKKRRR